MKHRDKTLTAKRSSRARSMLRGDRSSNFWSISVLIRRERAHAQTRRLPWTFSNKHTTVSARMDIILQRDFGYPH
jgi:hypothetical protein